MPWRTLTTRRQCRPARLDQYVNHDSRLIFKARLVFKARPLLTQLRQTPGLYSRPGLYLRPGFYSRKYGSSQNYQFRQYFASVYRYSTNRTSTMNCTVHHEVQYCNLDHFMTKHHFGHSIIIKVIRRKLFTNEVAGLYQYLTNIKQYL